MTLPIQAKPVERTAGTRIVAGEQSIAPSGCCVQVAGVCLASSPLC